MAAEHEKKLRELAKLAANVAELIQHNDDSPRAPGGRMQRHVLIDMRMHGPDPVLQAIAGLATSSRRFAHI